MKSKVYFAEVHSKSGQESLLVKLRKLFDRAGFGDMISQNDIVAVKIHFGEKGNTAYIRPTYARQIVDKIKEKGGKPFLTDSNTLYNGSRANGVDHYETAIYNGFAYAVVNAPIIIADGMLSKNSVDVEINKKHFDRVKISKEIESASKMIVMSHYKGHENAGFGGAIKNLAMGCAPAAGKQQQHSVVRPKVSRRCVGCENCLKYCPAGAITKEGGHALIGETCIGCGECIIICSFNAIQIQWNESPDIFQKKMVEYAFGVLKGKEKKIIYINFVMQVSPACDCYPNNDAPIVRDIGILASTDPVAIDTASCDLVNNEKSIPNTAIKKPLKKGDDKWRALYPSIDWNIQLEHAQMLGLGEKTYTLVKI